MKHLTKFTFFIILSLIYGCTSDPNGGETTPTPIGTPGLSIITTLDVVDITMNTANSGGIISNNGNSPITQKGIVWSTNPNPTINLTTKTADGTGNDSFTSEMVNLESNKTYYVRAYAKNINGTAYGNQVTFKTLVNPMYLPSVSTLEINDITTNSSKINGRVTNDGISNVSSRGFVWNLETNPTLEINAGFTTNGFGLGNFNAFIENLQPNKTYYIKAYATSSYGTGYGEELTFTTSALLYSNGNGVTDYNGNTYNSVIINNKEWTTKNLNVTRYRNGDIIPQVQNPTQWANLTTGAWCYYQQQTANGTVYGKLYNWYAVNDSRGLAPTGWHIATNEDFEDLISFLGGNEVAGSALKQTGTNRWEAPNTGATNASGLTFLPGGFINPNADFLGIKTDGYFWTSDNYNPTNAWCVNVFYNKKNASKTPSDKKHGYSVRIVKD
jgi:uncharacterized protein (TIGR02145 family)